MTPDHLIKFVQQAVSESCVHFGEDIPTQAELDELHSDEESKWFFQRFAELVRNQALEDCADVCQKAGYLAMDIHIRDLLRKSKQQVFADVIGKMKS